MWMDIIFKNNSDHEQLNQSLHNHNGGNCEVYARTNPNEDLLLFLWSIYPYKDPVKRTAE